MILVFAAVQAGWNSRKLVSTRVNGHFFSVQIAARSAKCLANNQEPRIKPLRTLHAKDGITVVEELGNAAINQSA